MRLHPVDWLIVVLYIVFALWVGVRWARKAGQNVDEFFLSGRSLPWWLAGTSMVATSFAADTPLVVTGWVRDYGIWKNWLWWCFAVSGMLGVFLFSRWWRRGGVMTKAELVELRYGDRGADVLRGVLGVMHASMTNTITLCWVLLAAAKILDVLFGVDKLVGLAVPCAIALTYSLLSGFWGVIVTDVVQFFMAMTGAVALAVLAWTGVGGGAAVLAAVAENPALTADTLRFLPRVGPGGPLDASFWTVPAAALAVYLGVSWWAAENVDGSGVSVQRICAARDERQGVLASLWYNLAHYALRPWPWILVALASLVVLPAVEVTTPYDGVVEKVDSEGIHVTAFVEAPELAPLDPAARADDYVDPGPAGRPVPFVVALDAEGTDADWRLQPIVGKGAEVLAGDVVARTDSERAYVVMMARYLPIGLMGIACAALLAAFMSTIDTHVNLAASFFVNDVYRRFLAKGRGERHYVAVARLASIGVMALAGLLAYQAESISDLFLFFLAFLGGVGPVYVMRWLWWRIRASTEIVAMLASATATITLTFVRVDWPNSALSPVGTLAPEGRLILVVVFSLACALVSLAVTRAPDPAVLVGFYRRIRPLGAWGPVRALAGEVAGRQGLGIILVGAIGGLAATYGLMLGTGFLLLGRPGDASIAGVVTLVGAVMVVVSLRAPDDGGRHPRREPQEHA